jgi:hypothetical protein
MGSGCVESIYRMYLTRFGTYKIALLPQTKTEEGRGPHTDKYMPQNPFRGQFLRKNDL